jgi:hypothetical protein
MTSVNRRDILLAGAGIGAATLSASATAAPSETAAARSTAARDGVAPHAGSGAANARSAHARAGSASNADFNEPALNLLALLKMLGSTNPRDLAISFGTGRVYACLPDEAPIPLFSTHSVSVTRSQLRADGSFLLRQHIVGFRTAFDGDRLIERMANPLTGETVELPVTDYGIGDLDYRLDGTYALRSGTPATKLERTMPRPWHLDSGTLAINDDAVLAGPGPKQPKADVVTRFAPVREVLDPKTPAARSWFSFSAIDPFRPWLKMPRPGYQLWHVYGRSVHADRPLPEFIDRVVRERFAGLLELAPI